MLLVLAACQSAPRVDAPSNPLNGTAWLAWDIDGHEPGAGTYATLVFNGRRVVGTSGCNRFSGALQVGATELQAKDVAVTRMQCGPELMKEEASFLHALHANRRVRRTAPSPGAHVTFRRRRRDRKRTRLNSSQL